MIRPPCALPLMLSGRELWVFMSSNIEPEQQPPHSNSHPIRSVPPATNKVNAKMNDIAHSSANSNRSAGFSVLDLLIVVVIGGIIVTYLLGQISTIQKPLARTN